MSRQGPLTDHWIGEDPSLESEIHERNSGENSRLKDLGLRVETRTPGLRGAVRIDYDCRGGMSG